MLAAAMVVASIMPAIPVMAAEDTFPLAFGKWVENKKLSDDTKYTFNMPSSGRVRLSIEADYTTVAFIDDVVNNKSVASWIDGKKEGNLYLVEDNIDLVKGKYKIRLQGDLYGHEANYKIKVDFTSAEESFPETIDTQNNSQSRGSEIDLNKTYKGQLAYNDSADWYKFEAPQNTKYKLDLSYVINECKLTIKDSWGKSYLNEEVIIDGPGTWTNYSNELTLPEGEYYFAIEKPSESEANNNNGNYSFSIKSDAKPVNMAIFVGGLWLKS